MIKKLNLLIIMMGMTHFVSAIENFQEKHDHKKADRNCIEVHMFNEGSIHCFPNAPETRTIFTRGLGSCTGIAYIATNQNGTRLAALSHFPPNMVGAQVAFMATQKTLLLEKSHSLNPGKGDFIDSRLIIVALGESSSYGSNDTLENMDEEYQAPFARLKNSLNIEDKKVIYIPYQMGSCLTLSVMLQKAHTAIMVQDNKENHYYWNQQPFLAPPTATPHTTSILHSYMPGVSTLAAVFSFLALKHYYFKK